MRPAALHMLLLTLVASLVASPALAQQKTVLKRRSESVFASLPFDPSRAKGFSISPGATRCAYVRTDGGSSAVIDGIEGPVYGSIGRGGVAFSPDSHHAAYAAEKDGKWRLVLDGVAGEPFDSIRDESITFSEAGARMAYVAEREGKALAVVDETAGPVYPRIVDGSLAFSPDGAHVAYVADDGKQQFVVYDGTPGPAYGSVGPLRFGRAGGHFAYAASTDARSVVVLDGQVLITRDGAGAVRPASLTFAPDGNRIAFVARADGKERVVFDGAEGKPYERVYEDSLVFGGGAAGGAARLAYVAKRDGRARVVVDGTEVATHAGVVPGSVRFSPDGRRVAYLVELPEPGGVVRRCAAVDGFEGKPYDWVGEPPVFSVDGRHVAYSAERRKADGAGFESVIVVDGAESKNPYPWIRGDPVLRADGRRVAYLAVAPDERFADAGMVPRAPGDASAGARLVFHHNPAVKPPLPPVRPAPVKLLVVEEDVIVD